jgi:zinc protease
MIHEFTIANGLKVIGIESHKSPVVSVQMWVRNGSADERAGDEGLSHFIEHLVFKGSRKYKVGQIASEVEACGGELNAYTSFDQTVFYVTISKLFFDKALDVVSEMVGHPLFDAAEIDNEREVVIEEIKRGQDSLSRKASQILFSSLYPDYPYAVPVIGYDTVVRTIPKERIVSFFHERYVPKNMFLVVTGNFKPEELRKKVESYFLEIPDEVVRLPARPPMKMLDKRLVKVEKAPFEEAIMNIAWPAVDVMHDDVAALECLSLIFGQGGSSRLTVGLRLNEPLVNYVGAGLWAPATQGFFSVSAGLNPENFEKVLAGLRTEFEKLFALGVTTEELYKAKVNFMSEDSYALETVGGLARKYGGNFELTHNINFHEAYYKKLEKVTTDDVLRVAQKYLNPEKMLISAVVPGNEDAVKAMLDKWTFNRTVSAKKPIADSEDGKIHEIKTSTGLRLFSRQNKAAPVFHMRYVALSGARVLPPEKAGLTELLGRVWSAQTKHYKEEALSTKIDSLASSVYSFVGRNTIGLVVDGLAEFQTPLTEMFNEVLVNRDISEKILEREKKMVLESLRSRKDSPSYIASLMFHKLLFGNHPYAMDMLGNEETMKNISVADIEDYLQKYLRPQSSVVGISGSYNKDLWLGTIENSSKHLAAGVAKVEMVAHADLTQNIYAYELAQKEQAHIIYGFKGLSLHDEDRFTLQIIEAILAGQGGRLFLELRDKASLAYSVSPLRMEGMETGYFGAYIGCSPEKSETAVKMMEVEFQKLMEKPVAEEELQRAKNYLVGGHDIGLQKNSSIASSMAFNEIYGLPCSEIFQFSKHILPITPQDVQRVSRKIFSQKHVIVAVGPREPKFS